MTLPDTIVAPATPEGVSALAMLRLDGAEVHALTLAALGRTTPLVPRKATLGIWHNPEGQALDQVVVTFYAAGASATGNTSVEIACHGNPRLVRALVTDCLTRGARMAEPGEFTRRAFLNGKIDLTQAEAIAGLVHAESERALESARRLLAGELGRAVAVWSDRTLSALATLEAHIDFPEEDLPPEDPQGPRGILLQLGRELTAAAATARHEESLRNGIRLAVVGAPNAGKSSLLNALCGSSRALVSPVAGTTRDYLEAEVQGLPIRVTAVDTAGLRTSGDALEAAGMERTREQAARADFLLWVVDQSCPPPALTEEWSHWLTAGRAALVTNKSDLPAHAELKNFLPTLPRIACCLLDGRDASHLRQALGQLLERADLAPAGDHLVVGTRHAEAMNRAAARFSLAAQHLEKGSQATELAATEVRAGLDDLAEVVGKVDNERMLDKLFASFCIGK